VDNRSDPETKGTKPQKGLIVKQAFLGCATPLKWERIKGESKVGHSRGKAGQRDRGKK